MGSFLSTDNLASKNSEDRIFKLTRGNNLTFQEKKQIKHTFDRIQDAGVSIRFWKQPYLNM